MYLLDSNIFIYYLNVRYPHLNEKLLSVSPSRIKIPAIVEAEIFVNIEKIGKNKIRGLWENFFDTFESVPFDKTASRQYAIIRAYLEKKGTTIGPHDLIISATVLANNGILVTHNTKEFKKVPHLIIEDWTTEK
jgi:tRNA(fMet)-specific endonuclease VapC